MIGRKMKKERGEESDLTEGKRREQGAEKKRTGRKMIGRKMNS